MVFWLALLLFVFFLFKCVFVGVFDGESHRRKIFLEGLQSTNQAVVKTCCPLEGFLRRYTLGVF